MGLLSSCRSCENQSIPIGGALISALLLFSSTVALGQSPTKQRQFDLAVESPIMLTKGSVHVLEADLEGYLATRVPPGDIPVLLSSADRLGRILENLVRTNALVQRAESEGLLDLPGNQARMVYALARETEAIYREHYLSEVELESYEERAREIYLTRPDDFRSPPRIGFDHLLVTVGEDRTETQAMRLMVELHEKLAAGSDFLSLVQSYSDDPMLAENGGSYSDIDPGLLVPGLAQALDELSPGEWTDPVRSQFGWHLARLTERTDGAVMGWEEARPVAIQAARQEHLANALERLVRDIHDAEAVFEDGTIERLYRRYGVPVEGMIEDPRLGAVEAQ